MNRICIYFTLLIAMMSASSGCGEKKSDGGPANETEKLQANELKLFTMGYYSFLDGGTPPANQEDLLTRISSDRPIEFDRYVIIYGVDIDKVADQKNTILAYVKEVPTNGGMVALVDGSTRRVTADEFKNLAKAVSTSLADKPADVSPSTKQFSADFGTDALAGVRKYHGKIVELKGRVIGFESSSDFDPPITFDDKIIIGSGEPNDEVYCATTDPQPWRKYSKGQQVTIKGNFPNGKQYPILIGCVVLTAGANNGVVSTANALAKEYESDSDATSQKYSGKSFVITGEVMSHEKERFDAKIVLKGTSKHSLICKLKGSGREKTKMFRPGDTVKIYGEFPKFTSDKFTLENCQLILD